MPPIPGPQTLRLNLKGCYFDAIQRGEKSHEYRLADKWEGRIEARRYRPGFDEILLLRGYPSRTDSSRMMRRRWNGYTVETITHPHFGSAPVRVLAIDVTQSPSP